MKKKNNKEKNKNKKKLTKKKFDKILKTLLNTPPEPKKKRNKNEIRKCNLLW